MPEKEEILCLEDMDRKQLLKEVLVRGFRGFVIAVMISFILSDLVYFYFRMPEQTISEPVSAETIFWMYTFLISPALILVPLPRTTNRTFSIFLNP